MIRGGSDHIEGTILTIAASESLKRAKAGAQRDDERSHADVSNNDGSRRPDGGAGERGCASVRRY